MTYVNYRTPRGEHLWSVYGSGRPEADRLKAIRQAMSVGERKTAVLLRAAVAEEQKEHWFD